MRRGFTLLEILVTILIFSILVTISGYVYSSALSRSRDQQRISDLQTISNGLEQFYLDNKKYPDLAAPTASLFVAKFQLEPFQDCRVASGHGFLVPTYTASIPEDPRNKFVPSIGNGGTCTTPSQAGQYLYVPIIPTTGQANDPVKDFALAAKVERLTNVSDPTDNPTTKLGLYRQAVAGAGILFCTNTTNPSCTHNRFLGPKDNQ